MWQSRLPSSCACISDTARALQCFIRAPHASRLLSGGHLGCAVHPAGMSLDPLSLAEQLRSKDAHIAKMAGTLAHYRAWASQIQARYQMFNPDAARPARRIYVGGLPPDTEDVCFKPHMLQSCSFLGRHDHSQQASQPLLLFCMHVPLTSSLDAAEQESSAPASEGWDHAGHYLLPLL